MTETAIKALREYSDSVGKFIEEEKSDDDYVYQIIRSHKTLRDAEIRRNVYWHNLRGVKRWLVMKLGVRLWP